MLVLVKYIFSIITGCSIALLSDFTFCIASFVIGGPIGLLIDDLAKPIDDLANVWYFITRLIQSIVKKTTELMYDSPG